MSNSLTSVNALGQLNTTAKEGIAFGNGLGIIYSAGTPEGVLSAGIGNLCIDKNTGDIYRKASGVGNTGWLSIAGGASYFQKIGDDISPTISTDNIALNWSQSFVAYNITPFQWLSINSNFETMAFFNEANTASSEMLAGTLSINDLANDMNTTVNGGNIQLKTISLSDPVLPINQADVVVKAYVDALQKPNMILYQTITSADYAMLYTDQCVVFETGNVDRACTLPSIATCTDGQVFTITKNDSGTGKIIIMTATGTINGQASYTITYQYDSVDFNLRGSNWFIK